MFPFVKKNASHQNEKIHASDNELWTERDWNTRSIIHHLDHAWPNLLTTPGGYYQTSADDFSDLEELARKQLDKLSISIRDEAVFNQAVRLRTLQLQNRLLSERLYHYRDAVHSRTDALLYVHRMEQRLADLKAACAVLEEERRQLLRN